MSFLFEYQHKEERNVGDDQVEGGRGDLVVVKQPVTVHLKAAGVLK